MVGQAGSAGASGPAKRGRPATNAGNSNTDGAGVVAAVTQPTLGPLIQVHNGFAEQNHKRLVLALQSGLKGELTWALNTLTMLSYKEKDDNRKDSTPMAKIPGLLDALLHVINEWRDIGHNRESAKLARPRTLGAGRQYTGFGAEYDISSSADPLSRLSFAADFQDVSSSEVLSDYEAAKERMFIRTYSENWGQDESKSDGEGQKKASDWWWDEEGLFNLDELGRAERQQCAVAASNVIRNFTFMPENEQVMAQHRLCLESLIASIENHETEDEELVTNALESIVNLAPFLLLKIFGDTIDSPAKGRITVKRVVQAILGMLESQVRRWHCSAAELIGRLVVNPDNESFILSFATQIYRRLVDLLGLPVADAQAAAVAALYNFAEINMDCRLRLANERWAVGRLLRVVQAPHSLAEICRKAALTLESLASEPQNRAVLMSHENSFVEIAMTDMRMSDIFARILFEMSSGTNSRVAPVRGVWGS